MQKKYFYFLLSFSVRFRYGTAVAVDISKYHPQNVLLPDVLIYFPAVYIVFASRKQTQGDNDSLSKDFLLMLLYPGLILIDYGHFQYNCISLGFAVLAVACLARDHHVWGSALFCLALNYKQMELYHAMPFFCYLLGTCIRDLGSRGFWRLVQIGVTVIATFALCWAPFLYSQESVLQVIHRLFPVARGVYEDKVASVWCALSVVVKLKNLMSQQQIVYLCLSSTLLALVPSSLDLLIRPSFERFKYALVNSALVFFLFSFQVHEKSILIPAVIVCILIPDQPFWCFWFLTVSTFSMLALLIKDGSLVPYIAMMALYSLVYLSFYPIDSPDKVFKALWADIAVKLLFCVSMVGVVVLTVATLIVAAPENLPDLFTLLNAVFSCGHFLMFLAYFHYCQFSVPTSPVKKVTFASKKDMVKSGKTQKGKIPQRIKAKQKKE